MQLSFSHATRSKENIVETGRSDVEGSIVGYESLLQSAFSPQFEKDVLRMLADNASHLPSMVPSSAPPAATGDDIDEAQVSVLPDGDAPR